MQVFRGHGLTMRIVALRVVMVGMGRRGTNAAMRKHKHADKQQGEEATH